MPPEENELIYRVVPVLDKVCEMIIRRGSPDGKESWQVDDGNVLNPVQDNAPYIRSWTAMPELWCSSITQKQARQIKIAVESTCELCREYTPLTLLELHGIPVNPLPKKPGPKGRERHILVVCSSCHRHIHELPVPEEKLLALIEKRPFVIRREFLQALGYVPKHYSPPEDIDIPRVFDETVRNLSTRFFR